MVNEMNFYHINLETTTAHIINIKSKYNISNLIIFRLKQVLFNFWLFSFMIKKTNGKIENPTF